MAEGAIKKQILKDFEPFKRHVLGIILFGSQASNQMTKRSDIDICLVVPEKDPKEVFDMILESPVTGSYDVKIFETLPLYMKGEVLESSEIVWAADEVELSYYLYKWRRRLTDQRLAYKKLGIEV